MQRIFSFLVLVLLGMVGCINVVAQQQSSDLWDLNRCITYAQDNSLQVKQMRLEVASNQQDLIKSKSEWLPSLNASVSEDFSNSLSSDNTGISLSSSMPIYSGGAIANGVKVSKLSVEQASLNVEQTQKDITLSIVQAYLNILYSKESLDYNKEVVATSEKQVQRTRELYKSGSVVRKDLAQMESQLSNDNYSLVVAQNSVVSNITVLKQLLEIPVMDTFKVAFPEVQVDYNLFVFPSKSEALESALATMPEIKSVKLGTNIAETELKIAKSSYYPSLSLSAGYSTNYSSSLDGGFGTQLSDNQIKKVGLTLSIPIFNRNSTKTSVQKSRISVEKAKLTYSETEKNLLQTVETVYQDAIAALSRYKSAEVQMEAATESYKLSEQQFNVGMINTVELLDVKTSLLDAKSELTQAKYAAILNLKILDFYMGKPISL
ncbi:MAG: TolC family protein [Bacteroidales bacterium]